MSSKTLFKITFRTLAFQFIAFFLRAPLFQRLFFSALKPLQTLNDDGIAVRAFGQENPSMYQLWRFLNNFVAFDARTIYLQKWLNDYYDPVNEGIIVRNNNFLPVFFMFNAAELATPTYFFNQWDSTIAYVASPEDYVYNKNDVFVCIANNTNKEPPDPSFWTKNRDIQYFFNATGDTLPTDYTVQVPIAVELQPDYTTERITSQINLFNAAGKTFNIQII